MQWFDSTTTLKYMEDKMTYEEFLKVAQKEIELIDNSPVLYKRLLRTTKLMKSGVLSIEKKNDKIQRKLNGKFLFDMQQTFGFPPELTVTILEEYLKE